MAKVEPTFRAALDRHGLSDDQLKAIYRTMLDVGGEYAYRVRGENHVWTAARSLRSSTPCAAIPATNI